MVVPGRGWCNVLGGSRRVAGESRNVVVDRFEQRAGCARL